MARLPTLAGTAALAGALVITALGGAASPAGAGEDTAEDAGYVQVLEVSGLLDPVLVDFVQTEVDQAERDGATGLVLQLNSGGAVVDDEALRDLATTIGDAEVPVAIWVGPSGAGATHEAAELVGVSPLTGMAPATRLGDVGEPVVPVDELRPSFAASLGAIEGSTVGDEAAVSLGLVDVAAPTVGDFVLELEGFESALVLDGERVEADTPGLRWGAPFQREPLTEVRFAQLSVVDQLFHTVASPAVAYLLFAIGMGLLLFELYTAGVGVAGVVGAGSFLLACYGLGVLPVRPVGVGLLVLAFVALGVDVQTGVPRFWTGVGLLSFAAGTFLLYDGVSLSWITVLAGFAGIVLFALAGMPAMVRTRFSTPTIGRDDLVGELGEAMTPLSPEGTVVVRDAPWRARVNRATPIEEGQPVRVAAIEGLVLEVEPLEGAARDHRERRSRRGGDDAGDAGGGDGTSP